MLKNSLKVCASGDNLRPVAQRERQATINTENSKANTALCYHCRRKYQFVHWYINN